MPKQLLRVENQHYPHSRVIQQGQLQKNFVSFITEILVYFTVKFTAKLSGKENPIEERSSCPIGAITVRILQRTQSLSTSARRFKR
jgi:hypothetical protein